MPTVSMPAPVGGWNARDDLGNMPPEDAIEMINARPRPGRVEARRGFTSSRITSPSGTFNAPGTIQTFRSTFGDVLVISGGDYLYGWDGDVSDVPTEIYTGSTKLGSTYWDAAHFQDKLIMTLGDGSNLAQVVSYDGTTISATALNITSGPNEEDIRGVQVHKGRAYYWETAAQSFWYAAAGAYQGALTEFPLDTAIKSGGALQMMLSISMDGGGGQDDLAAFVFSSGEVLVYQGDDPGDSTAWELVGSFEIGQPVDPQAHAKIAGTELVFTKDGVIDLIAAIRLGRFGESAEFSNKISITTTEAAKDYVSQSGWQVVHSPRDNCVILNIPQGSGVYEQYVRETDTGGWWKMTNCNGRFAVFQDQTYFVWHQSGQLRVSLMFSEAGDATGQIEVSVVPAYNAMRSPSQRKVMTAVKPFINGDMDILITGLADFDEDFPDVSSAPGTTGVGIGRISPVISTFANGHFLTFALQFKYNVAGGNIQWNSTTVFYENAGPV